MVKNKYKITADYYTCLFFQTIFLYSSFFFEGESSFAHVLFFNKSTTTSKTFSRHYVMIESLFKTSSENLMLKGNLLPCEIFPECRAESASQSRTVVTIS